jgi:hypothetical protein
MTSKEGGEKLGNIKVRRRTTIRVMIKERGGGKSGKKESKV